MITDEAISRFRLLRTEDEVAIIECQLDGRTVMVAAVVKPNDKKPGEKSMVPMAILLDEVLAEKLVPPEGTEKTKIAMTELENLSLTPEQFNELKIRLNIAIRDNEKEFTFGGRTWPVEVAKSILNI